MLLEVEATYEHGSLKLPRELPLQDGQRVTITIMVAASGSAAHRMYGMIPWTRDPEELRRFLNDPDQGQWGEP